MSADSSDRGASGRGSYHDGLTARLRAVRIAIEGDAVVIAGDDGVALGAWPVSELKLIDRPRRGEETRFTRLPQRLERLTSHERAFSDALFRLWPHLAVSGRPVGRGGLIFALVAALLLGVAIMGLPYATPLLAHLVPAALERRIGDAVLADLVAAEAEIGRRPRRVVCSHTEGLAALRRLLDRLNAASGHSDSVRLVVIDSKIENAYALPGGTIVVMYGLLKQMGSAELSGVLAHELTHVRLDHAGQDMVQSIGLEALISVAFGGGAVGKFGDLAGLVIGRAYSRRQEAEADRGAIAILRAAGLRVDGMANLFASLESRKRGLSFLATHPAPAERKAMFAEAGSGGASAMTIQDWAATRHVCTNLSATLVD